MTVQDSPLTTPPGTVATPAAGRTAESGLARINHRLWRMGLFARLIRARPGQLTVLLYHRIADPQQVAHTGFAENVSATPECFDEQMRYVKEHFTPIAAADLAEALDGRRPLPPHAALVTFDDGYRDNHDAALPILKRHGIPALLFVAVGCVGSGRPFYWDLAGYCFGRSPRAMADLPVLGLRSLDGAGRQKALREWVRALKQMPEERKEAALAALPQALGVVVPPDAFAGIHATWAQLAEMQAGGVEIAAHTVNHPILARIPPERAREEIRRGKAELEKHLGRPVRAFAYPNGGPGDFTAEHEAMLRQEGFTMAFTTLPGPCGRARLSAAPLRIPRICITAADTPPRFAAKVCGFARMAESLRNLAPGARRGMA